MEWDIMVALSETSRQPAFTIEELTQIYEASGHSTDEAVLQAKARELFPDSQAPLYLRPGGSRAFDVGDGVFERPAYTLSSHLCRCIGIMKNGGLREY